MREAFIETAQQIGELFSAHARTKKRAYHQPKLGEAAFKDSALAALLVGGLGATELPPLPHVDDAAFSSGARDLLERLSAEPTDEFYKQHKDALNALESQEPTQRLLHAAIALTRPDIRDTMETREAALRAVPQAMGQWHLGLLLGGPLPEGWQAHRGCTALCAARQGRVPVWLLNRRGRK